MCVYVCVCDDDDDDDDDDDIFFVCVPQTLTGGHYPPQEITSMTRHSLTHQRTLRATKGNSKGNCVY